MASSLAPGFIVAAPSLLDPNFRRAVVLLVEHRAEGSLGFIVNRAADVSFRDVAAELKLPAGLAAGREPPVLVGGPVAPHSGWIVFEPGADATGDGVVTVSERLAVSASREMLEHIARGDGPSRRALLLGYAGWGAGQLDEELRHGAWIPTDLDDRIVFDAPLADRWTHALASLGIDPARIVANDVPEA